jgi:hypothetical protein
MKPWLHHCGRSIYVGVMVCHQQKEAKMHQRYPPLKHRLPALVMLFFSITACEWLALRPGISTNESRWKAIPLIPTTNSIEPRMSSHCLNLGPSWWIFCAQGDVPSERIALPFSRPVRDDMATGRFTVVPFTVTTERNRKFSEKNGWWGTLGLKLFTKYYVGRWSGSKCGGDVKCIKL